MSFTSAHNDYLDPDIHNPSHYDDEDEWTLTAKQKRAITSLRREADKLRSILFKPENRRIITIESLFEHCPEGDFCFDGEAEDVGNAWNCGDSDCESGWHESVQCIEQGRKDGKTWFVVREDSIAGCGDYQPCAGWDEREGDKVNDSTLQDLWFHLDGRSIERFLGWAAYNLDCAVTGKDPLNNRTSPASLTVDRAITAARDNIKYLRKDVRRLQP